MKTTVIIPTLNAHEPWLLKAVASCSFADEIIITRRAGIAEAVNEAVAKASGDYVAILPDDDYFLPEVEKALKDCGSDPDVIHFPCRHQIEEGDLSNELFDVSPGITAEENKRVNRVHGSSFIRKSSFFKFGGYAKVEVCHDWVLWTRALREGGRFVYYPNPCVVFRWNAHSVQQKRQGGLANFKW